MLESNLLTEIDPELNILGIVNDSELKMAGPQGPMIQYKMLLKGHYFVGFWDRVFRIMVNGFTDFLEQQLLICLSQPTIAAPLHSDAP